jgi:Fe-S oxidoreductase
MAMVSLGDLDAARKTAEHNLRILAPFAREGYKIICTEPSAAACFKMEYPRLSSHPDVQVVAKQTMEAGEYLLYLHKQQKLKLDFISLPRKLAYHLPCHVRAFFRTSPFYELLQLVPDLKLHHVDKGCSGMAGPFGMSRENYSISLKIGEPLLESLKANTYDSVMSECSSCRMQITHGSRHHTIHPIKLLVMAYGIDLPGMVLPDVHTTMPLNMNSLVGGK